LSEKRFHAYLQAQIGWLAEMFFVVSTCLTKISNLAFYIRLGQGTSKRAWLWTNYAGIAFTASYMIAFTLLFLFTCHPIEATWMSFDLTWLATHRGKFKCKQSGFLGPMVGILSVVTDVIAAVLPAGLFWNLHMPKKEKILLWAIFGLGLMCVFSSDSAHRRAG
jgi:hypothetical protein